MHQGMHDECITLTNHSLVTQLLKKKGVEMMYLQILYLKMSFRLLVDIFFEEIIHGARF